MKIALLPSIPTRLGCLDLCGQGVEIDKQEFTKLVHLVDHLLGRLFFAMHSVVAIESKFVCPSLQLRGNPMLSGHPVDALFDFPCLNIRGKIFQSQFHGLSIHSASGIKMPGSQRGRRLREYFVNAIRDALRCIVFVPYGIHRLKVYLMPMAHQVAVVFCRSVSDRGQIIARMKQCDYRHCARATTCTNNNLLRSLRAKIFILNFKCHSFCPAVRAVAHNRCHKFPYQKEILS